VRVSNNEDVVDGSAGSATDPPRRRRCPSQRGDLLPLALVFTVVILAHLAARQPGAADRSRRHH
jgi:hypothetical protein